MNDTVNMRDRGKAMAATGRLLAGLTANFEQICEEYDDIIAFKLGTVSGVKMTISGRRVNSKTNNTNSSTVSVPHAFRDPMIDLYLKSLLESMRVIQDRIDEAKKEL